jgi:hypothetical protein
MLWLLTTSRHTRCDESPDNLMRDAMQHAREFYDGLMTLV